MFVNFWHWLKNHWRSLKNPEDAQRRQELKRYLYELDAPSIEKALDNISNRIDRELTLFAGRMGWLLTLNSFLFAPVGFALRFAFKEGHEELRVALHAICFIGFLLTTSLSISIILARYTLDLLKKRYKLICEALPGQYATKRSIALLSDTDFLASTLKARFPQVHEISMFSQQTVIVFILLSWMVLDLYIIPGRSLISWCYHLPFDFFLLKKGTCMPGFPSFPTLLPLVAFLGAFLTFLHDRPIARKAVIREFLWRTIIVGFFLGLLQFFISRLIVGFLWVLSLITSLLNRNE